MLDIIIRFIAFEFAPPANARYPITAGWTGGAGGRQMEKLDGRWKN